MNGKGSCSMKPGVCSYQRRRLSQTVTQKFETEITSGDDTAATAIETQLENAETMKTDMQTAIENENLSGVDYEGHTSPTKETQTIDVMYEWEKSDWSANT
eukprot:UN03245